MHDAAFLTEVREGLKAVDIMSRLDNLTWHKSEIAFLQYKFGNAVRSMVDDGTMPDDVAKLKSLLEDHAGEESPIRVKNLPQ